MIESTILLKLAASAGIATDSELLNLKEGEGHPEALNDVFGGVASNFIHQYSDKIDIKGLGRFLGVEGGQDYESLNYNLEKLMIATLPEA
jgi:hypothetical protein